MQISVKYTKYLLTNIHFEFESMSDELRRRPKIVSENRMRRQKMMKSYKIFDSKDVYRFY